MGHLAKLTDEYGGRGLNVIGLTTDEVDVTRRFLVHTPAGRQVNYAVAVGGGGEYGVTRFPYAYLIGPDGTVAWEGNPGSLSDKTIEKLLGQVERPAAEQRTARAAKAVATHANQAGGGKSGRTVARYSTGPFYYAAP